MKLMERLMLSAGAVERGAYRLKLWAHARTRPWVQCDECRGAGVICLPDRIPGRRCRKCGGVGEVRDWSASADLPAPDRPAASWSGWGCALLLLPWLLAAVGFWAWYHRGPVLGLWR